MAIIETHGLTKTFQARKGGRPDQGGGKPKPGAVEAVRGVDLTVEAGEIFGFLGPNGAGKTTTMRMLSTLLEPTSGEARVCEHDLIREPGRVRRDIGYVGQRGGAERDETGRENLVLQGCLYGLSDDAAKVRAAELIAKLDLDSYADRYAKTYSGGQRRRLDVAMGMVHRPQLLFLDEPTTGLDPQSRARIWEEVRRLRDEGMTIFLTTHYMDEADGLCDRLAVIDNGQLVSVDTPNGLKRQIAGDIITLGLNTIDENLARVKQSLQAQPFLRELQQTDHHMQLYVDRGEEVLPEILRLLDRDGASIRTVTLARPTLDDVFLRLTGRSLRESPEGV